MIPTTLWWILRLVVKIDIAIAIFYLIKLCAARVISSTVCGFYDITEKHPVVLKVCAAIFSISFIGLVVFAWMYLFS